jgi:hypothetical protein
VIGALVPAALPILIIWGLERNHRRQPGPRPPLAGSTNVRDRDTERLHADLRCAAGRQEP